MATIGYIILQLTACVLLLSACATTSHDDRAHDTTNPGITWVQTSAEYDAISLSVYRTAQDALAEKIANKSWSALPYQAHAEKLPTAIILDVDETVVSNVEFQRSFIPPFSDKKLDDWKPGESCCTRERCCGIREACTESGCYAVFSHQSSVCRSG